MLSSLGGMFQHFWSLPISMSLTQPNHRTNNQFSSSLTPHTHTHTHTHRIHVCRTSHTQTHKQHMYTTLHTYTSTTHVSRFTHTHRHTHTDRFLLGDRDPDIPVHAPCRAWLLVGIPPLLPGPLLPGPADWSWLLLCRVLLDHVS